MLHFTNIGPMELLIAIALFFQGLASLATFGPPLREKEAMRFEAFEFRRNDRE